MSLTLLRTTVPFQYELCQPGDGTFYNAYLCTLPRLYREELSGSNSIIGFYYNAQTDRYVLIVQMNFAAWPSFRFNVYEIDPDTGLSTTETLGAGISNLFFTRSYQNGEFKQVYANRFAGSFFNTILSVDSDTYESNSSDVIVSDADVGGFIIRDYVLNRSSSIVALSDVSNIRLYNYSTQTLVDRISIPETTITSFGYETNELAWALLAGSDSKLSAMKFNYLSPNIESLTLLPDPGETVIDSGIAYDSRRKNIGVFSQLANASDGGHRGTLQIFKPITSPTILTEPVPLEKIQPGRIVTMEAHLVDNRAVAGSSRAVKVTNSGDGTILQPTVTPRSNGTVAFQYLAGANPGTDTITLEVDI